MKRRVMVAILAVVAVLAAFLSGRVTAQTPSTVTVVSTTGVGWGQFSLVRINGSNGRRACVTVYESLPLASASTVELRDFYLCD